MVSQGCRGSQGFPMCALSPYQHMGQDTSTKEEKSCAGDVRTTCRKEQFHICRGGLGLACITDPLAVLLEMGCTVFRRDPGSRNLFIYMFMYLYLQSYRYSGAWITNTIPVHSQLELWQENSRLCLPARSFQACRHCWE